MIARSDRYSELGSSMMSSAKILKPDTPPKRRAPHFPALRSRLRLWLFPARHLLAIWHAVAKQRPAAERKLFRRHRA